MKKQKQRFKIDFFEFAFLVEACILPSPIARAMFWDKVLDRYYDELTNEERIRLFEWVNRNEVFKQRIKEGNEDCLLFNQRYDPNNQYLVTTYYDGTTDNNNCFLWENKYYVRPNQWIQEKHIIDIKKLN